MDCQAPILPILGKPITHVGLVSGDDASRVPSLALSIASCQAVVGCWVHPRLAHPPAFRIDGRSLPEGGSISWFTQGWELRPPSAIKLSAQVVPFEPALPLIPRQTPVSRERVAPIRLHQETWALPFQPRACDEPGAGWWTDSRACPDAARYEPPPLHQLEVPT